MIYKSVKSFITVLPSKYISTLISRIYVNRHSSLCFINLARNLSSAPIKRPPVVTIMGHVDHGKTSLLDYLRNSEIVQNEFGGITQHIGAFVVPLKLKNSTELVTFLDTPGHAAFAAMRQRGANVTDIIVLVIACEDGPLDQTLESINFAKASEVPIIVAVNKIDKFQDPAELSRRIEIIRKQLFVHDVISEEEGGDVQMIKISALYGTGVDDLKEAILALAETLNIKARIDCPVRGTIIESKVDPHRGKLCTILVKDGILRRGDILVAGKCNYAKARALFDERNQLRQDCGPGLPIQVPGWREEKLPGAGDHIYEVANETEARRIVNEQKLKDLTDKAIYDAQIAEEKEMSHRVQYKAKLIEKRASGRLYGWTERKRGVRPKETQDDEYVDRKVNLLLKCDVNGSLEAILSLLDTYDPHDKQPVKLDLMHYGVGAITESDLLLASSFSNSLIYGFHVKPVDNKIILKAKQAGVRLNMFTVIYHLIDDLKAQLAERSPFLEHHMELAKAQILQQFEIDGKRRKIQAAGCKCIKGPLRREMTFKLVRNDQIIVKDLRVETLMHYKKEVKEIEKGQECGISFVDDTESLERVPFEFRHGDVLIGYEKQMNKVKIKWDLKGFA